jgi:hypothetical protein
MFVLLEHQTSDGAVHWDLLIEVSGQERLATWRLAENPIGRPDAIAAERIGDHRRVYLDYEGPLSEDRGKVRRLDRGACRVGYASGNALIAELMGQRWHGIYEIVAGGQGGWVLQPRSSDLGTRLSR